LKDDGILALHVTNIHVDLFGVVRQLALHSRRTAIHIEGDANRAWDSSNNWVLITSNRAFLKKRIVRQRTKNWPTAPQPVFWTDDFSNLFEVVDW
jgi:hypothetical protein